MDLFWPQVTSENIGNVSWENISLDVVIKGCFDNYDTTACVRNSLLAFLGFLTVSLCVVRIMRLHLMHHLQIHQYLIFYLATFEVAFLILKWIVDSSLYQLEFAASYLKMIQFILLCQFHWSLVSRILHRQKLIQWFIIPVLVIFFIFLTFITILGVMSHYTSWIECLAPHWLLLSMGEFLGVQLYVWAGIHITRKINSISALDSFKREQKRDLWSVILTYEFASVISLSYYLTMKIVGNFVIGCSGVFDHAQEIYSPIYAAFMIIKYLLPIWVMLLIFYPTRGGMSSDEGKFLGWSGEGSTTSMFNPGRRGQDFYKTLSLPGNRTDPYYGYGTIRRSASSPALSARPLLVSISEDDVLYTTQISPGYDTLGVHSLTAGPSRSRARHDSGQPGPSNRNKKGKAPFSLNHCSDELLNVNT